MKPPTGSVCSSAIIHEAWKPDRGVWTVTLVTRVFHISIFFICAIILQLLVSGFYPRTVPPQPRSPPNRFPRRAEARKTLRPLKDTLEIRPTGKNLGSSGDCSSFGR